MSLSRGQISINADIPLLGGRCVNDMHHCKNRFRTQLFVNDSDSLGIKLP